MGCYIAQQTASAQLSGSGVEDWLITITPPSTTQLRILKVRFGMAGATATLTDGVLKLLCKSFSGSTDAGTQSTVTIRKSNETMVAAQSTSLSKSTTNAFTGGTVTNVFQAIMHEGRPFMTQWTAIDREDEIVCPTGESFGLSVISPSGPTVGSSITFAETQI